MNVTVMTATEKPIDNISLAAGTSYRKDNVSYKRVESCVKHRHTSVLEHATITFRVDDVSRDCMAQLTRHRLVSFVVVSQRYCKYDLNNDDWYIIPPSFKEDKKLRLGYQNSMNVAGQSYMKALQSGIPAEDARYLLPGSMRTSLTMTLNARELFSIFNLRLSPKAQWEIRELAEALKEATYNYNEQWSQLIDLYGETQDLIM